LNLNISAIAFFLCRTALLI